MYFDLVTDDSFEYSLDSIPSFDYVSASGVYAVGVTPNRKEFMVISVFVTGGNVGLVYSDGSDTRTLTNPGVNSISDSVIEL